MTEVKQEIELKRFGDLEEGDIIIGSDGQPVKVVKAYDEHIPEKMFEIEMDDGTTIKASGNHLWYVETMFDKAYLQQRKKHAKKVLKALGGDTLAALEEIALKDDEIETTLNDMIDLCDMHDNKQGINVLVRIAEAIGHIVETEVTYEDFSSKEQRVKPGILRSYDARQFSQQLLVLHGGKEHKKKWDIIVGAVITTEDLVELGETAEIPFLESRE